VVWSALEGVHAQAGDGAQKILGGDIAADLAGGGRGLEESPKRGFESLLEIRGQGVESRVPRMQRRGQAAFGGNKGRVALHPSRQRLTGPVLRRQGRRGVGAGVDLVSKDGRDELGALRKVPVEGADADARLLGYLPHRSVRAGSREDRQGRLEQRFEVALDVGPDAPIRAAVRLGFVSLVFRFVVHLHLHLQYGTMFRIDMEHGSAFSNLTQEGGTDNPATETRRKIMHYRTLGKTGIKVSPYCLGAMMFGAMANSDHDDCIRIIHKALDFGINFVDTADRYSNGESEEIVGKALKDRRDTVVLATKVHGPMGKDPNQQGNSRRWITQAVEASLRRLQTDHIDLYQIHRPSPDTDIEETLSVLTDLMRAGKVRAIGSSTFPASEIVEAQWVAERRGLARFRTEQPPYSMLDRGIEREVLPACERYGMGVMVWSPLSKGMLTGRYRKGQALPDSLRVKVFPKQMSDERNLEAVERLIPIAEAAGLSLTHMAMGFVMAHPDVTSAILGPRTMQHLDDLLAGAEVRLNDEILDEIDQIVPPGIDVAPNGAAYNPPAITQASLRRRPVSERAAAAT
jgi:aryl-alcohol dehydrogenase-like predicted oxidoreductase